MTDQVNAILGSQPYLLTFIYMLLKEAGFPSPLPGDVLLIYAATFSDELHIRGVPFVAVAVVASLIGSTALYVVGRYKGAKFIDKHGRWIRMTPPKVKKARRFMNKYGAPAVFMTRVMPGMRTVSPLVAGTLDVPWRVFLPVNVAAVTLRWTTLYVAGLVFGDRAIGFLESLDVPWFGWVLAVVFLVGGFLFMTRGGDLIEE